MGTVSQYMGEKNNNLCQFEKVTQIFCGKCKSNVFAPTLLISTPIDAQVISY